MKKLLLSFFAITLFTTYSLAQSQMLYGLASSGGAGGYYGTLYKLNPNGSGFNVIHNFMSPAGWMPMGNVIQATDGNLYGCCHEGGIWASCTIWRYDLTTNTYADVWDFDIVNGDFPKSGVVQGPDGKLWGAAFSGGTSGSGVIYSYDIGTDTYTAEHSFSNAETPFGVPIFIGNVLYGLTPYDTSSTQYGAIYSYDISNDTYAELHHFTWTDGALAYGSVFQASNGKLYGMTSGGGVNGLGVVFSYEIGTDTYTKLHDFSAADGSNPQGGFAEAANGKIYGMAMDGGLNNMGTIFTIQLSNNMFTKVHDFDGLNGANPKGDLYFDATANKFYGTTFGGGTGGFGTTFNFDPIGNTLVKTFDFDGTSGSQPNGALSFATMPGSGIPQELTVDLSVFPNPVTDCFTVSIAEPMDGDIRFELFDMNGKVVSNWIENNTAGNYTKMIDMRSFANGSYTLKISNGTNQSTRKIVK